ncbi:hypothetical protein AVEN_71489-1 [Araneus ventricosus]|uniref:Uncharacterized protein n=1 Tax=Araneus ventricosus TaxID=182803 RepID=A0A4Y2QRG5_ARAVE|nr:hypothetical protein AVEN_71489-1 [Araneus ventricosus]
MLVLRLGREFYRGMYWNSGGMEPSTTDHFGDEMWDLKSTGIFLISLIRGQRFRFIQMILIKYVTSRPVGETINRPCSDHSVCVDRLGSPLECERLRSFIRFAS